MRTKVVFEKDGVQIEASGMNNKPNKPRRKWYCVINNGVRGMTTTFFSDAKKNLYKEVKSNLKKLNHATTTE